VACEITIRQAQVAPMFAFLSGNAAFPLIYPTKLLLIKIGFFREANSMHLDALDDWTRQRLSAFRLRYACQQGKCIDEICD